MLTLPAKEAAKVATTRIDSVFGKLVQQPQAPARTSAPVEDQVAAVRALALRTAGQLLALQVRLGMGRVTPQ